MSDDPREVRVGGRLVAPGAPPFVIAEIGVNHDGSPERAVELVRAAAAAGVDAVKFQWFEASLLVGDASATAGYQRDAGITDQRSMLAALQLGRADLARAIDVAHESGVAALVTVFSTELVDEARTLDWDGWKTASPDLVHRPLLEALATDGRPMFVSTGAAELSEVVRADTWLRDSAVALLHCVSAYPTPEDGAELGGIRVLKEATGRPCGYSDHTAEETTGGLAVAAGACVLEKHLTWSTAASGPDHAASIESEGLARYVTFAGRSHRALGAETKSVTEREHDVRVVARQSIRAGRDLRIGHRIEAEDLVVKRPGDGIEPWRLEELIGLRLRRAIDRDQPVREDDVAWEGLS